MTISSVKAWVAIIALLSLNVANSVAYAIPTTFVFQTSSVSVPGFDPTATITINGTFADLPTLANDNQRNPIPGPFNFGNLLGLSFEYPNPGVPFLPIEHFNLNDFTEARFVGSHELPLWSISPNRITFLNYENGFVFDLSGSTILAADDQSGIICSQSGGCVAQGSWAAVPEPSTISLLAIGLAVFSAAKLRRRNLWEDGSNTRLPG